MTNSMKKTKYSEEEFSLIVDEAAIILQRKSDHVMNIKQVAEYLGISEGAVRKRCQRKQLPFIEVQVGYILVDWKLIMQY